MRILVWLFVLGVLTDSVSAVRKHKHVDHGEKGDRRRSTDSESGSSDEYDREVNSSHNSEAASGEETRQAPDQNAVESPENVASTSSAPPANQRRRPENPTLTGPPEKKPKKIHHHSDETTCVVSNFENY